MRTNNKQIHLLRRREEGKFREVTLPDVFPLEGTPIVMDGVMYLTVPMNAMLSTLVAEGRSGSWRIYL